MCGEGAGEVSTRCEPSCPPQAGDNSPRTQKPVKKLPPWDTLILGLVFGPKPIWTKLLTLLGLTAGGQQELLLCEMA